MSFKELCLLHLRDHAVQPFRPLHDLLNDRSHEVTWSTLQRILRISGLTNEGLQQFAGQGRLDSEKLEFGRRAIEFMNKEKLARASRHDGVYQNIYQVIWTFGFDQDYTVRMGGSYRGQWDSRWRQVSSLLRDKENGQPLDVQTLADRLKQTEEFVSRLRDRQTEFFATPPTDDELLAVAQHYGFPTPMLDYTASLRVAAWFATSKAAALKESRRVIGVIHRLSRLDESEDGRRLADSPGISEFRLLEGAAIRTGNVRYVKPQLAAEDNRIARQQGMFVTGFQPRDLHGVKLGSFFFWQEPGEVFQDPFENVTTEYLLPDRSPVALLANQVKEELARKDSKMLPSVLGAAAFPYPGLFGSSGFALQAALTDGGLFFKSLEAHISRLKDAEYVRQTLAQVFDEYFQLCRIRADLGNIPSDRQPSLDPFALALLQLARLSGVEEARLMAAVAEHLPPGLRGFRTWSDDASHLSPSNDAERIALASGVFLASWELLQYVNGDAARDIATDASGILGPLDDSLGFTLQ